MNKNFEPLIIESYAELCVRWRMAHVESRPQAEDYDAQLKSLEAVIKAFGINLPGKAPNSKRPQSGNKAPATQQAAAPAKAATTQPPLARAGGIALGD